MIDALGNKLSEGQYLLWVDKKVLAQIAQIIEPKIDPPGERPAIRSCSITLLLTIPVDVSRDQESRLMDFMRVVDPSSDQLMDNLLGKSRQPPA